MFDWPSITVDDTMEMLEGFGHHELIRAVEVNGAGSSPAKR